MPHLYRIPVSLVSTVKRGGGGKEGNEPSPSASFASEALPLSPPSELLVTLLSCFCTALT